MPKTSWTSESANTPVTNWDDIPTSPTRWANSHGPVSTLMTRVTSQGDTRVTAQGDTRVARVSAPNIPPRTEWAESE